MDLRSTIFDKRGFLLLEPVLAAGLIGGLLLGGMRIASNQFQASAALEQRLEYLNLKSVLLTALDCEQTLPDDPVLACNPASNYLDIKNGDDRVIFASGTADGTKYGNLFVRAQCNPKGLQIEVHPRTLISMGQPLDWKPLFPDGLQLCQAKVDPVTPPIVIPGTNTTTTVEIPGPIVPGETIRVEIPGADRWIACVPEPNPQVDVCEEVAEFKYDACTARGKKAAKCARKEARVYRKCNRWASRGGNSVMR